MYQPGLIDPTKQTKQSHLLYPHQKGKVQLQPTTITVQLSDQIFFFESLGVFVFVFGTNCFKEPTGINLHFFLSIFMTFVVCNHPSNSNINPAVTFGFCFRHTKRYQLMLLWLYFKAQFCGAFAAYALSYLINGVYRAPLQPQAHNTQEYIHIILSQIISVFVLILLILQITGPNTGYCTGRIERYLFIGLFVYLCRNLCPGSYFGLNLALVASRAFLGMFFYNLEGMKWIYLWGIGDLLGASLAIVFYNYLLEPHVVAARIHKTLHVKKDENEKEREMGLINFDEEGRKEHV